MDKTRVIVPNSLDWPRQLDDLGDNAPEQLWVRGSALLDELTNQSVAIVGSRACTSYGSMVASDLAYGVAWRKRTVVSGGAFGIDVAAHAGAMLGNHPTVVVLSCGVDMAYPSSHAQTFSAIIRAGGLIVSEYAPGEPPRRERFLKRNRIIAALAQGMVLVEANMHGGSRHAFGCARDLGRKLMVVPGPVTSAQSTGTMAELRIGDAIPVGSSEHIVEAMGWS